VLLCGLFLIFIGSVDAASGASITVDESGVTSIAHGLMERVMTSWPWYVTRASGIVAAVVMVVLMLSGIGFITGTSYAFLEPITAWATHRTLGIILTIALVLHIVALYFDHFVPFGVADLLVPFVSDYMTVSFLGVSIGSLYVALGILAFYIIVLIVVISLIWIESRKRLWKVTHLLSYLAMAFVFVHALYLGTDLSHGFLRWIWVLCGIGILIASVFRLWRSYTV